MTTLMRAGNIGSIATSLHPNGNAYVLLKRDMPGGSVILLEQAWNGAISRIIKVWASKGDFNTIINTIKAEEKAAGRRQDFLTQQVDRPISSPSLVVRPDGSILLNHTFGGGDGLCDWSVEILPNVCTPFTHQGTWPLTVSATDDVARRAAQAAHDRANVAYSTADAAKDAAKKAADQAGKSVDVLKIVSDDIANDQGRLRHALWPRVQKIVADVIYLMLKDAASPLINVIKQGGHVIK